METAESRTLYNKLEETSLRLNKERAFLKRYAITLQMYGHHFAKRSIKVPYFPPIVWIEPTSVCNLHCPMCLSGRGEVRKISTGFMDMHLFSKIIDELKEKPVIRTALFFRGEPLLNRNIVQMVNIAAQNDLSPYFHTNGTMMNASLAEELIRAGLSFISFSFDGESKEHYETIRKGGSYETTLNNIRVFLEVKKRLRTSHPFVVVQNINFTGEGKAFSDLFKQLFRGLPVDLFSAPSLHNWSGEIDLGQQKALNGDIHACPDPWQRLTICWDGTVVACCNDMLQKYVLGDVSTECLGDIWNGKPIQNLRKLMAKGGHKDTPLCSRCSLLYADDWLI